jgi:hypothetical protein
LQEKNLNISVYSDINLGNDSFHVQTEDWGVASPYIVSRIYKNGAVLKSIKTPYSEIIDAPIWDKQAVEFAVKSQHDQLVEQLLTGRT